jgi:hypothetical protein
MRTLVLLIALLVALKLQSDQNLIIIISNSIVTLIVI